MAWHNFHHELTAFPTPFRGQDVHYPDFRPAHHGTPFDTFHAEQRVITGNGIEVLLDTKLERYGDLGWTLDYATAWCYRHLVGSQPEVVDAIDAIREMFERVDSNTPYYIFDFLDQTMFDRKLKEMVSLHWTSHPSCGTGSTYAPGVIGIPRIVIKLNAASFMVGDRDIDDLLDALIHQMIHAYFLVCCGAQKRGEKADGRLMDGIHFGVLQMTIRDVSTRCADGPLKLIFHAMKRRDLDQDEALGMSMMPRWGPIFPPTYRARQEFISIDPRSSAVGSAPADGQTHCLHDNRKIRKEQIKNWQVEEYSKALDLGLAEMKGDKIWDWDKSGLLVEGDRVKAEPSATFAELIWNKKRVMVSREKALAFPSIVKPLKKHSLFELELPDCDLDIFSCIYDFMAKPGHYRYETNAHALQGDYIAARISAEAPILLREDATERTFEVKLDKNPPIMTHLKVFHAAEEIKFEELMRYALQRLYRETEMTEDPIQALEILYRIHPSQAGMEKGPISSELHKWARKFLLRRGDDEDTGMSNCDKLLRWHRPRFQALYHRCPPFQDDVIIAGTIQYAGGEFDPCDPISNVERPVQVPLYGNLGDMAVGRGGHQLRRGIAGPLPPPAVAMGRQPMRLLEGARVGAGGMGFARPVVGERVGLGMGMYGGGWI
ncbi:hypothetical protein DOTSEDRAFT_123677 [Dothistroma septosporum NZE10]|uniref:SprT-like domain-containing protein n=1 Tax=Dothistroma septosporum (strain NZE10 / CBS 128990) TaxID=675120 RepID=N1PYF5_DOTSN|nr:hypothetical protein DOTSEDRAFT_123677 [Dothistroma septosporum NZE10]